MPDGTAVPEPGPARVAGAGVTSGRGASFVVDDALLALESLETRPVGEHVAVFDGVHQALQNALATLDGS